MKTCDVRLITVLAACLVVSEGSSIRRDIPPPPTLLPITVDCPDLHAVCADPHLSQYEEVWASEEAGLVLLSNATRLEELSAHLKAAVDCIDTETAKPTSCLNSSGDLDGYTEMKFMSEYLATPGNIDKLFAATASPCMTEESLQEAYAMEVALCSNTFTNDLIQNKVDFCTALFTMETCTVEAGTEKCGQAVGELIESFWGAIGLSETNPGVLIGLRGEEGAMVLACHQQVSLARRFVKRALETLRR